MLINFLSLVVTLSLILGIVLVILYAILNPLTNTKFYYRLPRFFRNIIDMLFSFSTSMGPFFILTFIFGRLLISLFRSVLGGV